MRNPVAVHSRIGWKAPPAGAAGASLSTSQQEAGMTQALVCQRTMAAVWTAWCCPGPCGLHTGPAEGHAKHGANTDCQNEASSKPQVPFQLQNRVMFVGEDAKLDVLVWFCEQVCM